MVLRPEDGEGEYNPSDDRDAALRTEDDEGEYNLSDVWAAALRGAISARGVNDPEDAAQDALLGILTSRTTYDAPAAVARVAGRRRGIDHGRRAATRNARESAYSTHLASVAPSAEDQAMPRLYVLALLEIAKKELTPDEFDGLYALYQHDGSIPEAARTLAAVTGRSFETIRTQIRRGVAKLRNQGENSYD